MFSGLVAFFERMDVALACLAAGANPWMGLCVAALLGLRHAGDPDHIAAVSEMVAERRRSVAFSAALGAAWGGGHALTLLVCGGMMLATNWVMPENIHHKLEMLIGIIILVLAMRMLWRWKWPPQSLSSRSIIGPHSAFAIGGLHGLAGSGGVVLLLLTAMPDRVTATYALILFALGAMVSMAACSIGIRFAMAADYLGRRYRRFGMPVIAAFNLDFGLWYIG